MRYVFLLLMFGFIVTGCGGGDIFPDTENSSEPVEQMGFSEGELYNPLTNPSAPYLTSGKTAVLSIEAEGTEQEEGDTLDSGNDSLWIKLDSAGYLGIEMEEADLASIDRVEIFDSAGSPMLSVDRDNRTAEATLEAGVYEFRFHAGHTSETPEPLFISFTETAGTARADSDDVIALRAGKDCTNCDFSKAFIKNLNLNGANLSGSNFRQAVIRNSVFTSVNFTGAKFNESTVSYTDFISSVLNGASFERANINDTEFMDIEAKNSSFYFTMMYNSVFSNAVMDYTDFCCAYFSDPAVYNSGAADYDLSKYVAFENCRLPHANFNTTRMLGTKMKGCDISSSDFVFSIIIQADFTGSDMRNAKNISIWDLSSTLLSNVIWTDGRICAEGSVGSCY